ncbi:MAG: hypothetical protein AMXMBFR82_03470 [Candidatus Hydrogenedentota bacterium]
MKMQTTLGRSGVCAIARFAAMAVITEAEVYFRNDLRVVEVIVIPPLAPEMS